MTDAPENDFVSSTNGLSLPFTTASSKAVTALGSSMTTAAGAEGGGGGGGGDASVDVDTNGNGSDAGGPAVPSFRASTDWRLAISSIREVAASRLMRI